MKHKPQPTIIDVIVNRIYALTGMDKGKLRREIASLLSKLARELEKERADALVRYLLCEVLRDERDASRKHVVELIQENGSLQLVVARAIQEAKEAQRCERHYKDFYEKYRKEIHSLRVLIHDAEPDGVSNGKTLWQIVEGIILGFNVEQARLGNAIASFHEISDKCVELTKRCRTAEEKEKSIRELSRMQERQLRGHITDINALLDEVSEAVNQQAHEGLVEAARRVVNEKILRGVDIEQLKEENGILKARNQELLSIAARWNNRPLWRRLFNLSPKTLAHGGPVKTPPTAIAGERRGPSVYPLPGRGKPKDCGKIVSINRVAADKSPLRIDSIEYRFENGDRIIEPCMATGKMSVSEIASLKWNRGEVSQSERLY